LFEGEEGIRLISSISSKKSTFVPGEGLPQKPMKPVQGPTPEEAAKIRAAIASATTLEEINRLKRQLEGGALPLAQKGANAHAVEMEED
jgi:hypothetical protein